MSPMDPRAAAFLAENLAAGTIPDHLLTVAQMRAAADISTVHVSAGLPVRTTDTFTQTTGGRVPLRVARPDAAPLGVVVYAHGGGHVTGTTDSYDHLVRRLAVAVPATVVLVGYRRAPEHRCPAPVADLEAAYRWAHQHLAELAAEDTGVALAGDSAGGNLTAVLCHRLRGTSAPAPTMQVLVYPTLDAVAYRRSAYLSHRECATGCGLTHADGLAYWDHYLGPGGDPSSPEASPLRAADLSGLPPTYVLSAEYDVLRDEGRAYAERLATAGTPVTYDQQDGQLHGFLGDPGRYPAADTALSVIAGQLRRQFEGRPTPRDPGRPSS